MAIRRYLPSPATGVRTGPGASTAAWALIGRAGIVGLCAQALLWALPGTAQAPQGSSQSTGEQAGEQPAARAEESLELPAGEGPSVDAMADVERALEAYEASEQISEDAAVSFPVDI